MSKDPLSNTFNLPELFGVVTPPKQELIENKTLEENLEKFPDDFDRARNNLIEASQRTNNAIAEVVDLASMSQSARMYEVLSALIKTQIEASRELMALQKQARDIHKTESPEDKTIVNNNLILTTAELQEVLGRIEKEKKENG